MGICVDNPIAVANRVKGKYETKVMAAHSMFTMFVSDLRLTENARAGKRHGSSNIGRP